MEKTIQLTVAIAVVTWMANPTLAQESASTETESDSSSATPSREESSSRFRWGISVGGGPLVGGYEGGAGGIDARFGMQIDSLLGVYGQPIVLLGAGASVDAEGASASGLAMAGVGVLGDITLIDLIYLAIGPELLYGEVGQGKASVGSASAKAASGAFFSIASRAGIALGSVRPNRRSAFIIGLDMHVVFTDDVAVMPMVFLGYESF
jgi:hypothetical protein